MEALYPPVTLTAEEVAKKIKRPPHPTAEQMAQRAIAKSTFLSPTEGALDLTSYVRALIWSRPAARTRWQDDTVGLTHKEYRPSPRLL